MWVVDKGKTCPEGLLHVIFHLLIVYKIILILRFYFESFFFSFSYNVCRVWHCSPGIESVLNGQLFWRAENHCVADVLFHLHLSLFLMLLQLVASAGMRFLVPHALGNVSVLVATWFQKHYIIAIPVYVLVCSIWHNIFATSDRMVNNYSLF